MYFTANRSRFAVFAVLDLFVVVFVTVSAELSPFLSGTWNGDKSTNVHFHHRHVIDFSYQSHLGAERIARVLQSQQRDMFVTSKIGNDTYDVTEGDDRRSLRNRIGIDPTAPVRTSMDPKNPTFLLLQTELIFDISSCFLGDTGVANIFQSKVLSSIARFAPMIGDVAYKEMLIGLTIHARMNKLSPGGLSQVLDKLRQELSIQQQLQMHNQTTSTGEPGGENGKMGEENITIVIQESTEDQERRNQVYIHELDFSWNDFSLHHGNFDDTGTVDPISPFGTSTAVTNTRMTTRKKKTQASTYNSFLKSLRTFVEDEFGIGTCPNVLRFDACGLGPSFCRSIAKSVMNNSAFSIQRDKKKNNRMENTYQRCIYLLSLSCNEDIGDAGVAALAAALKTTPLRSMTDDQTRFKMKNVLDDRIDDYDKTIDTNIITTTNDKLADASSININQRSRPPNEPESLKLPVIHTLDLSSCNIGDAGVEALANALEMNPGCVRVLDLSNNKITDEGAIALGRALEKATTNKKRTYTIDKINLSNNKNIGDRGLAALASALECRAIRCLSLRSCSIQASGVMALGKVLASLASQRAKSNFDIDVSGNHFGCIEKKEKNGMAKYSANLLKSKASATTASYMNFIGNKIKSGLKEAGFTTLLPTDDSENDEDESDMMNSPSDEASLENDALSISSIYSGRQCGARAFSEAICEYANGASKTETVQGLGSSVCLGMRMCALDKLALDALAAAKHHLKTNHNLDLMVDVEMNPDVDEDVIVALKGNEQCETLEDMANRHFQSREAMRMARERATIAAEAVAARIQAEKAMSGAIGGNDDSDFDDELRDFSENESYDDV